MIGIKSEEVMGCKKQLLDVCTALFFSFFLPGILLAGVPEVSHVMVTDVTTRSFSVIWVSSEASSANLEIFEDESGAIPLTNIKIIRHPVESGNADIQQAAKSNGVMKVKVTGLEPGTTYYFKTVTNSEATGDIAYYPNVEPYISVITEAATVRTIHSGSNLIPFSNDVIIQPCYLADGITPAEGSLLVATVSGANYPLTAFVGDGVDLPNALIDLNNLFGVFSHENLNCQQGDNLTLLNIRGASGNSIIIYQVPVDLSLAEVKPPASALKPGWNMVSFQLEPDNTNTTSVLAPIWDKVTAIWGYDDDTGSWVFYDKNGLPFLNSLNNLHSLKGYWIKMDDYAALPVNGFFDSNIIQLRTGWNLIGYSSIKTVPISKAIIPISYCLNSIWTHNLENDQWEFYDQHGLPFLNNLTQIEPGKSYWINVNQDCNW